MIAMTSSVVSPAGCVTGGGEGFGTLVSRPPNVKPPVPRLGLAASSRRSEGSSVQPNVKPTAPRLGLEAPPIEVPDRRDDAPST